MSARRKSPRRKAGGRKASLDSMPSSGLAADVLDAHDSPPAAAEEPEVYAFARRVQADAADEAPQEAEVSETWVGFSLDGESFALPVSHVQEIARVGAITRVPQAPHEVRGVSNIRGRVVPVLDLRRRLGLPDSDPDKQSRILVVPWREALIGFLVDAVERIMPIAPSQVQSAGELGSRTDVVRGVLQRADDFTVLLDVGRLLALESRTEAAS